VLNHESLLAGITVYGLCALFTKAWLIVLLGKSLYEQCEFSPATIRHSIWMATLLSLFALPLLTLILPSWNLPFFTLNIDSGELGAAASSTSSAADARLAWVINALIVFYLVVLGGQFLRLLVGIVEITRITFRASEADSSWYDLVAKLQPKQRHKIKISREIKTPLTWGLLSAVIIVPERSVHWSDEEKTMVLRHECCHIQRADWLIQLLGQIVCILYWPVPGVHKALDKLCLEAEQSCDDRVLEQGVNAAEYAHLLLRQARIKKLQAAVSLGQPSEFGLRVRHIVSATVNRAGEFRMKCLLMSSCALFMLPYASFQAAASLPKWRVTIMPASLPDLPANPLLSPSLQPKKYAPITKPIKPYILRAPPSLAAVPSLPRSVVRIERFEPIEHVSPNHTPVPAEQITVVPARKTVGHKPTYPSHAARRGIEGTVVVEFDVDNDGIVQNPKVVSAEPEQIFNRSVLKAVKKYRFDPYQINGKAITISGLREVIHFQLEKF
jgi:bla regulator protein blaR1